MTYAGPILALAGLLLATLLFAREDLSTIVALLSTAGAGLVLASVVHIVPMLVNARAWQCLMPRGAVGLRAMTWATWIRESVNGLLPVGRVGGEIVAYRIVRHRNVSRAETAGTLLVDMALSVLSQALFALLGVVGLAAMGADAAGAAQVFGALAVALALGGAFAIVLRSGAIGRMVEISNRLLAGKLKAALAGARDIDESLRRIYAQPRDVAACFAWQLAGWIAGSAEIALALHFLGHDRSFLDALVIEALIQAVSSAAFIVPGALGVQEGAFLLVGATLGLDGSTALALAVARRLRDVIVFFPGLLAWQWEELRLRRARTQGLREPDTR